MNDCVSLSVLMASGPALNSTLVIVYNADGPAPQKEYSLISGSFSVHLLFVCIASQDKAGFISRS